MTITILLGSLQLSLSDVFQRQVLFLQNGDHRRLQSRMQRHASHKLRLRSDFSGKGDK
jgi:hypothetical protein